jgi:cytochrome c oxidase subunit III
MSTHRDTVPSGELPLALNDYRAPVWSGVLFIIIIEVTVFTSLIVSYYYLRHSAVQWDAWPLRPIDPPSLLMPTIGTGIILLSSLPIWWADRGIRRGDRRRLKIGLSVGAVLGLAFLVLKAIEYGAVDYRWHTNAYGSIVWSIIGFHSMHVVALLIKTGAVLTAAFKGYFDGDRNIGMQVNGIYWHFVVLIWLPLYATLYLSHLVL